MCQGELRNYAFEVTFGRYLRMLLNVVHQYPPAPCNTKAAYLTTERTESVP